MTTRNKNEYEIEVKYLNRICSKLLRILGVLDHFEDSSSSSSSSFCSTFIVQLKKFISNLICYALTVFFLTTTILHVILIEKRIHVKLRKMPILLYNVLLLTKYNCLVMRQKEIVRCMTFIEEDLNKITNQYHREIILGRVKYGKRFFTVICVFLHSTVLYMRLMLPLIKGSITTAENVTIRPLPSAGYYFHLFDDQVSPFYEIVYFLQVAQGCVTIYTNITICTLAVIFVVHACSQLEIFINLLENIVTNVDSDEKVDIDKKLAVAVKHHIRVRNFLRMIESTMNPLYFMDIFGCSLTQCFLGYSLTMDWGKQDTNTAISIVIAIFSLTVQIFVFCLVGEQLMIQDEKVALKSCILEWNQIPYKKAKNIIPIVMLSNHRMKITAGTIIELSLQTFGQVIKTTVAYCNIMRTMI